MSVKYVEVLSVEIVADCWALWLNRNAYVFRDKIIPNLDVIIYKVIMLMQSWSFDLGTKTEEEVLNVASKLKEKVNCKSSEAMTRVGVG